MNTTRNCGCKSFTSCLICEKQFGLPNREPAIEKIRNISNRKVFCADCYCLYPGWDVDDKQQHKSCSCFNRFLGIEITKDFVTIDEESSLISDLDTHVPWTSYQSGRRIQNFGPKANFKWRKVKVGQDFHGFPKCTQFVQQRFCTTVPSLKDYHTVEQCSIEYRPETGARIEPHIDDCWIWGERIIQLNLLSDSVLTCFPYKGDKNRYNLPDVHKYPRVMDPENYNISFNPFDSTTSSSSETYKFTEFTEEQVVRVPLPRRSLFVMYGKPRYEWEHCILRQDISSRRVVIAFRELTPTYLPGGKEETLGRKILDKAKHFW